MTRSYKNILKNLKFLNFQNVKEQKKFAFK